jgi:hypothetical protein
MRMTKKEVLITHILPFLKNENLKTTNTYIKKTILLHFFLDYYVLSKNSRYALIILLHSNDTKRRLKYKAIFTII